MSNISIIIIIAGESETQHILTSDKEFKNILAISLQIFQLLSGALIIVLTLSHKLSRTRANEDNIKILVFIVTSRLNKINWKERAWCVVFLLQVVFCLTRRCLKHKILGEYFTLGCYSHLDWGALGWCTSSSICLVHLWPYVPPQRGFLTRG